MADDTETGADHGLRSPLRRRLLMGLAGAPALALMPRNAWAAPPTAAVNTTGLAVTDSEVTVGILHSITGTMAISETGAQEAEKLAIQQINELVPGDAVLGRSGCPDRGPQRIRRRLERGPGRRVRHGSDHPDNDASRAPRLAA